MLKIYPVEVAGPLGTPLGLAQPKRASPRLCVQDLMFMPRGDRNLGVAFQTHPGVRPRLEASHPHPRRMQDWLKRLAVPFRTRRAPVHSEALRDAPRLRLLHLTQAQAGEGEGPCTGCRPTQGTHRALSQETHQLPGTRSRQRSCQPSEHARSCPG